MRIYFYVVKSRSNYCASFLYTFARQIKSVRNKGSFPDFMYYYYVRKHSLPNLHFWPHVVVYLDSPVDKCLENIRKEGNVCLLSYR